MSSDWRRTLPLALAMAIGLVGAGLITALPEPFAFWREPVLDRLVLMMPEPVSGEVAVVDIASARRDGWDRQDMQQLLSKIAAAAPSVIALDIILSANCQLSDQNDALAGSIGAVPTTLGFLLSTDTNGGPRPAPTFAAAEGVNLQHVWVAPGAERVCPQFESAARGASVASVAGDMDGVVRQVPALALAAERPYAGLAIDAIRLRENVGTLLLAGDPAEMRLGGHRLTVGTTGNVRFRPSSAATQQARTLTAEAVLSDEGAQSLLAGKIVFVGDSSPEAGALRATAESPLYPSVQIHADLAEGILENRLPTRPVWALSTEGAAAIAISTLAGLAGALFAPAVAALVTLGLATVWIGGAVVVAISANLLIDPAGVAAAGIVAGLASIGFQAARTRQAEIALRRRIGQLLPPDVVARFVREPGLLRLEGEERIVTALFTDVEGFTQTLAGIEPKLFVRVLDAYFTGMTAIVLAHGGMIDKLVGDAVHALFNAPTDLPDHVDKAIACALELQKFAEAFRQQPGMVSINFGRTRIGIETGRAILGDVGAADKIDYTAHGPAINLAARLEQANKALGTSICIGPSAAAMAKTPLRSLGEIDIRSFGTLAVFTPEAGTGG